MLNIFSCTCCPSVCHFGRNVYSVLLPIFSLGFLFVLCCTSCFYMLALNPLLVIPFANILLFSESFHFVDGFLCSAKAFKFNQAPFVYFCFYFLCFRREIQKDIAVVHVTECPVYVFLQEFYRIWSYMQVSIPFEFIFVSGVRDCANFILSHVAARFSRHHSLTRPSLLHCTSFVKD